MDLGLDDPPMTWGRTQYLDDVGYTPYCVAQSGIQKTHAASCSSRCMCVIHKENQVQQAQPFHDISGWWL